MHGYGSDARRLYRRFTAVTCFLPTFNYEFWVRLQQHDPARYEAEKQRIAEAVIAILGRSLTDVRQAIEAIDVSTPATVIRVTGNWKGNYEGWLLTPGMGFRPLRRTLPGLRQFPMVGQWVMPGGGLPSGLMTARSAVQWLCRQDRVPFAVRRPLGNFESKRVMLMYRTRLKRSVERLLLRDANGRFWPKAVLKLTNAISQWECVPFLLNLSQDVMLFVLR